MPLKRCTNAEGKKGWSWGSGGCQVAENDEASKKQAIRVGLKVEGPEKFGKIMKKEKASFTTTELLFAKRLVNDAEKNTVKGASFAEKIQAGFDELNPTKSYISSKERKKIPESEYAGPHNSFPVRNQEDLEHAAMLLHHAADPSGVKKNLIKLAKRKGLRLPATWQDEDEDEK